MQGMKSEVRGVASGADLVKDLGLGFTRIPGTRLSFAILDADGRQIKATGSTTRPRMPIEGRDLFVRIDPNE